MGHYAVRRLLGKNSKRYLRVRSVRWKARIVDGLSTIAERITRAGRMKNAHTPARIRSDARRFGDRCRERLRMRVGEGVWREVRVCLNRSQFERSHLC